MTTQTATVNREHLERWLECAERCEDLDGKYSWADVIFTIKEALSQPKQEPTRSQKMRDAGHTRRPKGWDKDGDEPEQEPVAYIHRNEYNEYRLEPHDNFDIKSIPFNVDVSLFKSPQRTWVGLTDEDIGQWIEEEHDVLRWAEAKLKQKNGYAEEKNT